jgi:hypothetical protein
MCVDDGSIGYYLLDGAFVKPYLVVHHQHEAAKPVNQSMKTCKLSIFHFRNSAGVLTETKPDQRVRIACFRNMR